MATTLIPPYMGMRILRHYEQEAAREAAIDTAGAPAGATSIAHFALSPADLPETAASRLAAQKASIVFAHRMMVAQRERPIARFMSAALPRAEADLDRPSPIEIWNATTHRKIIRFSGTGTPSGLGHDREADGCFGNAQKVDAYYRMNFGVHPINIGDHLIRIDIHDQSRDSYNNGFWTSEAQRVVFGRVDPRIFNPMVLDLDVLTHELGHAVTTFSSDLRYVTQSGALNESVSDVFAVTHRHKLASADANGPDTDWTLSPGLVRGAAVGSSLRSMDRPGTAYRGHPILGDDPQPDHMSRYVYLPVDDNPANDNGGVHYNSGIPNRAFALAAKAIGGHSWEVPASIWYKTLISVSSRADFASFAHRTITVASEHGSAVQDAVSAAWVAVGVDLRSAFADPAAR